MSFDMQITILDNDTAEISMFLKYIDHCDKVIWSRCDVTVNDTIIYTDKETLKTGETVTFILSMENEDRLHEGERYGIKFSYSTSHNVFYYQTVEAENA